MEIGSIIISGFAATVVLTTIMAVSKPLGISRMDIPFILGTLFTPNRNKATFYGFIAHLIIGLIFGFLYVAVFYASGISTWWFGMLSGFIHGLFVLSAGLQIITALHPRMANPYQGPTPTKQLQPPGFFALNYGHGTPVVTIIAHMMYGTILAFFYH
jgi:hypothetical protein